ncbi:MAG: translation initiation factor IF-3, partial [Wolbachia pipientis]|nr:translation initiation factor IF-3 [Wolbachia pipientis]
MQIKKNRINELITAKKVRLVDHHGHMVGIVTIEQALEAAQNVSL